MAMSVNRRIERTLPNVMGQRDPEAMIRVRSTDPIRASGLVPRAKAAHMTASDCTWRNAKKTFANRGPSTHDVENWLHPGRVGRKAGVELAMTAYSNSDRSMTSPIRL